MHELSPATRPPAWIHAPRPTGSGAVDAATALWRALAALGVREAVLAPGSRSAPLVYGLADPPVDAGIRAHVRIDERAAAFTALGLSRDDPAHPAVVATTSGTATAHLHAAVMEAHHSRIPLLVLTADRPAELREVGANQTTRQAGLFRSLVRWAVDLPAPTAGAATAPELRTMVSTAARAVAAATGEHPGPVHLNLGFRDPLVPAGPAPAAAGPTAAPERIVLTRRAPAAAPVPQPVPVDDRTVIVAGDGAGPAAAELAARHHLPLLAEPSSGARSGETLVPGYPALLGAVMAAPDHPLRPRRAIVLGRPTLSRTVLGGLLGADDVEVIVVDPQPDWPDAARRARLVVPAARGVETGAATDDEPPSEATAQRRRERLHAWRREAADAAEALPSTWQRRAALAVWEATAAEDTLVLGSSSLVRDLEQHAGPTRGRVIAGRGLAGIDGTISLAGGIALAQQARIAGEGAPGRIRLLLGDLTALHDLTGLLIGPDEQRPALDIVVVDDGGGRIFSGLEHAAAPPALLRRFFTTPHGADIAAAAAALGAAARRVTAEELGGDLAEPGGGLRVLVTQPASSDDSPNS
ncbi:2-succinyl-5-enolpyruvyl-6-hydroxy-3-cyclohexene-1-carboxylic-acid synthase [Brachybacterium sp. YJGR34]|uniref:2-succinyl-5-enolpyruvyl-6-hydroxy-3- cyclohexene-1-carboxylic-acid synthase n=1 Tax=Brachybacterium sp. YJGR34 TaxID=2059911 RepID=UPI001E623AAF|nr:2-succinyl-5-enolpyruvyl-6-hydroxy-3-cyclohexene-1-carboxylic-acid synthase [Brachybacterium sp. YJGR34]